MRGNPFSNFHRSAEGAGYPALLIVSIACLGLVVAPVALLGLTRSEWVLGVALLSMIVAVVLMAIAVDAALSDYEEPTARPRADAEAAGGRTEVAPLPRRDARQDREAA